MCLIQRVWMNSPPDKFIRVPSDQLYQFAATCLRTAGLRVNHAEQVAELLTNADLRGVRSHGTRQLNPYCQHLRDKVINPEPNPKVIKETDNTVLIDGDGGLGYTPMMMATELALNKAAEKGIAVGATCHIGHYGAAGHYVRQSHGKRLHCYVGPRPTKLYQQNKFKQTSAVCLLGQSSSVLWFTWPGRTTPGPGCSHSNFG